ncbi:hypothetical protein [Natronoglycomyces albus]|uniref:Uncharacterized protein n=1 Tax=Natronoglycomyces albus TaxID=2811108 RepID=A0A895XQS7_9ACTN|nr:hypothetical protein [Natronoglycomyces albus]QSB06072.1 hypothetical protein JQS30_03900 [Natronoglycomyces albus]
METAIYVALASFGAVVGIVVIFATVLGLLSWRDSRKRRRNRAKADAEAWCQLLTNQLAIAPVSKDSKVNEATKRAEQLHTLSTEQMAKAKKLKHFMRARALALAGLHNLNVARREVGQELGPEGPMPINPSKKSARIARDIPTGPSLGTW